jgi:cysteine desulfurase
MAAALEDALSRHQTENARQRALLAGAFTSMASLLPQLMWLAQDAPRLANTMCLAHPGVDGSILVERLDLMGFAVSTGSACMASRREPSHVIAALGLPAEISRSAIRISVGSSTTADEIQAFAEAYVREVMAMRK